MNLTADDSWALRLYVGHVVELVEQGVALADGDDLPVQLPVIYHCESSKSLHLG